VVTGNQHPIETAEAFRPDAALVQKEVIMKNLVLAGVTAAVLTSAALGLGSGAAYAVTSPLVPGGATGGASSDGNKSVPGYVTHSNVELCAHGSPQVGPNLLPQCG
jgi:hypothetical protein